MNKRIKRAVEASVIGCCLAVIGGSLAFAQDAATPGGNGEIVVTAQRRAERSLDVPISVTALNTQQLETANVKDLTDIAKVTPSLRFDRQSQFVQPSIRGIGTGITTAGGGSNVGIYIDGFYSPNPAAADFQLMNVDSIQVLKGPQGTLFGRNTTGGAILVQTAEPTADPHGEVKATYARFNERRLQGYATTGADKFAFDIEGLYSAADGRIKDLSNGGKDGDYENWSIRLGAKADFTDKISFLARYQHNENDDPRSILTNAYSDPTLALPASTNPAIGSATIANFAPAGTFTTNPDSYNPGANPRFLKTSTDIFQLTGKADLGWADLASYTQYRTEDVDASTDLDQIGLTIFQLGLPVENETWTQEFLLTSKPGPKLQWTAGLFYFNNTDTYITFIDNAGRSRLGGSSAPTESYAAFVDATYEVTPQWFVTLGLRAAHDQITDAFYNPTAPFPQNCFGVAVTAPAVECKVPDLEDDKFTPRVVVRYKPNDESSIYASYTQGYKAGILDVGGATGNPVQPEDVDAYEVGYKYDTRQLTFEAAAFYYDYQNLQVSLFKQATAQIINAASSKIYGVDASVRYQVTDKFEVSAGGSWTHARYEDFPNAPVYQRCPGIGGCGFGTSFFILGTPLKDVHMQRAPDFTGNIGANYTTDLYGGELALSGNYYYTSKFYFGPSGTQFPQDAYGILSLRAQWTDPSQHYTVAVFGDNVTDERYVNQVQYNNFGIGATWNDPVTYGVSVGAKF